MKKIILKKQSNDIHKLNSEYRIKYSEELNTAQYEPVMHNQGAALVIAGAGTGKTRTLIYRVARLIEDGVHPESILLLTFTRKASAEMLSRASRMLDNRCESISGATFHSFAMSILRKYADVLGYNKNFNIIDQSDSEDIINLIRSNIKFDKKKQRFPQKDTLNKIFSLSINRCLTINDIVTNDYPFYLDYIDIINQIFIDYNKYKKNYNLMDYDDLLINLVSLLQNYKEIKAEINNKYKYIMVDEYQDTNKLQHEIVVNLAGKYQNVLAVGDDAQSIYSFRGANFKNIIDFPNSFADCIIYKIEENFRSSQAILDFSNYIIASAAFRYEKQLFTNKNIPAELPKIISCENENQQSQFIAQEILELREQGLALKEIAVLFRSSFHSFDLELELAKSNIPYKKYGGMKFIETAHIKDLIAFYKIVFNTKDYISWYRILLLFDGIGPKSANNIIENISNFDFYNHQSNYDLLKSNNELVKTFITMINSLVSNNSIISEITKSVVDFYLPLFKNKYDDWQKRQKDMEIFKEITERYSTINDFLNDMALEPPVQTVEDIYPEDKDDEIINLSTIHSAKGLEWRAVFIIWALDGRFPSSKAIDSIDNLEEERRLFYVAATRAKEKLYISYPTNIFDRIDGVVLSKPSRFIENISEEIVDRYMLQEEGLTD